MATWIELLGVISTIIGLIVAIPTLYYTGRSVYRRFTHVRRHHHRPRVTATRLPVFLW